MKTTLDMRKIRYLNLFEKITKVRTKNCFFYNNAVIFAVYPQALISKAIGEGGSNVRRISSIIGKKIKVVICPSCNMEIKSFVLDILKPLEVRNIEVSEKEVIITAYRQNKAALFGRNKTRFEELKKILEEQCGKELRII